MDIGSLLDDTPKAFILKKLYDASFDALSHASFLLNNEWSSFLGKQGAYRERTKGRREKKKVSHLSIQENALTTQIRPYLRSYLKSLDSQHPARVAGLSVHVDEGISSQNLVGDNEKRADIRFETLDYDERDDLIFEAKVIRDQSDIEKNYLGDTGLHRFLREENPYTEGNIAGLIAYTEKNNQQEVKNSIEESAPTVQKGKNPENISVGEKFSRIEFATSHQRKCDTENPIWMFHLVWAVPQIQISVNE